MLEGYLQIDAQHAVLEPTPAASPLLRGQKKLLMPVRLESRTARLHVIEAERLRRERGERRPVRRVESSPHDDRPAGKCALWSSPMPH
ncbi:MAG: hypothetical protein V8T10_08755 [Merdibacter sp.]